MNIDITKEDKIITIRDARAYGGCINGWKIFLASHNFIWKDVISNGLKASQLMATGDSMAIDLVKYVYNRDKEI